MRKFYRAEEDENHQTKLYEVDCGYINGYHIHERLLEDVYFKITVDSKNYLKAEVHPDQAAYFKNMNEAKYLNLAVAYADNLDLFQSNPDSDHDVILYDHDKAFDQQEAHFDSEPEFVRT